MQFLGFTVLICLTQIIQYSFACNGYKVDLKKIENGSQRQPILLDSSPEPEIRLNDQCQLRVKGCITILKPISFAELTFVAKRAGKLDLLSEKKIDLCKIVSDAKYPENERCPFRGPFKKPICDSFDHQLDLRKYKDYLPKLLGEVVIVAATIVTDKGEKSTFNLTLKISKK